LKGHHTISSAIVEIHQAFPHGSFTPPCLLRVNPSRRERLPVSLVDIRYINRQSTKPEKAAIITTGVPDPHFCMHDPAVRSIKLAKVRPLLQKIKPRLSEA